MYIPHRFVAPINIFCQLIFNLQILQRHLQPPPPLWRDYKFLIYLFFQFCLIIELNCFHLNLIVEQKNCSRQPDDCADLLIAYANELQNKKPKQKRRRSNRQLTYGMSGHAYGFDNCKWADWGRRKKSKKFTRRLQIIKKTFAIAFQSLYPHPCAARAVCVYRKVDVDFIFKTLQSMQIVCQNTFQDKFADVCV